MTSRRPDGRPRIAYVFPGGSDRLGGAETQALGFFRNFDRARFDLDLCLLSPHPVFELEARDGAQVDVRVLSASPRPPWHPLVPFAFSRLVRARRYDLVHLYGLGHEIFTRGLSRWWGRARVVSAIRGLESQRGGLARWLNRATAPAVDLWISNSEAARLVFVERDRLPAQRILVVPNGVVLGPPPQWGEARRQARRGLGLPDDAWLIGCVANHVPVKRLEDVPAAIARLREWGVNAVALLVGEETSHTVVIRAAVERRGLDGFVRFLGFRRDVPDLLQVLDVLILTSGHEGLPASILEAMAAGLPVVASAVGGVPELVSDGVTGFLFPPGDVETLATRLSWCHAHPQAARAMGALGRRRVEEHYSISGMTRRLEEIYTRLLAARAPIGTGAP